MASLWTGWAFALLLGLRHASEPDHLAAVSTLLAERPGRSGSAWLGAIWGVGHSLALLLVGGCMLLLRLRMPERVSDVLELVVSAMLLLLGARSSRRAYRARGAHDSVTHTHTVALGDSHAVGALHVHAGISDHVHVGGWTFARRPLQIGLVHGMAGSGALTALALANMPSLGPGLIYMLLFGLGSVAGMALVTGVVGWPLRRVAQDGRAQLALNALAGAVSLSLGLLWGWPLVWRLAQG
jgi:hypothetical protein